MKKIAKLSAIIHFIFFAGHQKSIAQGIPVIDVGHIAATLANRVKLAEQITKQTEQIKEASKIFNTVKDIEKLQKDVQDALKIARSVKSLKWSDILNQLYAVNELSIDPNAYLDRYQSIERLKNAYQNNNKMEGAQEIFELFSGFDSNQNLPQSFELAAGGSGEKAQSQLAFAEMADKKRIQAALSYNKMAGELQEKSEQLSAKLVIDGEFSMTEAERIASMKLCNDYLLESFELKLKADELMRAVIETPNPVRTRAIQNFNNALLRASLSATPK